MQIIGSLVMDYEVVLGLHKYVVDVTFIIDIILYIMTGPSSSDVAFLLLAWSCYWEPRASLNLYAEVLRLCTSGA
jgi:hypothetical protein